MKYLGMLFWLFYCCGSPVFSKSPNIVFFLVDDMGWADLACYGSKYHETPNIDALAASGVRFTHAYAASPVCSPTRASIVTGRHPVRVDITDWIPGMTHHKSPEVKFKQIEDRDNLALEEVTFAESLKRHGYQTYFVGKWHLGDHTNQPTTLPTDQGFDVNIGGHHKGSPPGGYYSPWSNPFLENPKEEQYLTERLTDDSIDLIEKRDPEKPFLLYFCYYNVHTPIQPHKQKIDYYRTKAKKMFQGATPTVHEAGFESSTRGRQDNPELATMVAAVDDSVGKLMQALKEQNILDNTIVMFFSDNGGLSTRSAGGVGPTSNAPLRAGKGWLYEGGVREPLIIKAPGLPQGKVDSTKVVSMDLFPTMLDLAGLPLEPEHHVDGKSLVSVMKGKTQEHHEVLYFYYPHYHGSNWKPGASLVAGDWKLIQLYHWGQVHLYNLKNDPGESQNVASAHPEKVEELQKKLNRWLEQSKARKLVPMSEAEMQEHQKNVEALKKRGKKKKKK
jgi:arylsulfatase A-like enzyme